MSRLLLGVVGLVMWSNGVFAAPVVLSDSAMDRVAAGGATLTVIGYEYAVDERSEQHCIIIETVDTEGVLVYSTEMSQAVLPGNITLPLYPVVSTSFITFSR